MSCFYHFSPSQEVQLSLTEEDIERGSRKTELDEVIRRYTREKGSTVIELSEWNRKKTVKDRQ